METNNVLQEEDAGKTVRNTASKRVSWASVVQKDSEMTHYDLKVEEIDGMPTAIIPNSVFQDSPPLWEDYIVGKFLSKAPFVGKVHALVNRIWTLGDKTLKIDVIVVDATTMRFRIKDERARARILRRGMWNLCDVPVEMTSIPLWVIVKHVPPKLFSWKGLSALTSPLGKPKKLHPDTEACKNLEEAKVFVEVDLTKKLPKKFCFKSDMGPDTVVEYLFPWLPPRCIGCSKWGH
ncbi:hypothetical protein EUTSA_v10012394mg, partial [Eutrema salsugineum]